MEVTTDAQQLHQCPHPAEHAKKREKAKRRKGKKASTVVVVALCRSVRRRGIISQRWSPFCAIVVRQQVTVKLFEGLKGRAVPSVGICKNLTSNPSSMVPWQANNGTNLPG